MDAQSGSAAVTNPAAALSAFERAGSLSNHFGASISAAWPHALRPSFSVTRTRAYASVASVRVTAPKRKGSRRRTSRSRRLTSRTRSSGALNRACSRRGARSSPGGLGPDVAVVHELDLAPDHVAVLRVLHRRALEVEVLGIDRLVVDDLVELGAEVLHPVVPLRARPVVAERLDVDDAAHVRRARPVVLPADDAALVVDDEGAPAEGVDGRVLLGEQVVRAHVGRDDVHVVVERARPALDLENLVAGGRVRIRRAIDDLGAVHGQRARVLGIRALVGHHDAEAPDLGVGDGPEGVERAAVFLDPPVVDVVRADGVLDGEERRDLVMLEDDLAARIDDEPDVEEAVLEIGMLRLRLGHDEGVVLLRDLAQLLRLLARNIDGALSREGGMVEIENFVVEGLKRSFRKRDEPHREIQAREPGGGLDQVLEVLEVELDVLAPADAANGRDEAHGGGGVFHARDSTSGGAPCRSGSTPRPPSPPAARAPRCFRSPGHPTGARSPRLGAGA